jgi:hypothetical protein
MLADRVATQGSGEKEQQEQQQQQHATTATHTWHWWQLSLCRAEQLSFEHDDSHRRLDCVIAHVQVIVSRSSGQLVFTCVPAIVVFNVCFTSLCLTTVFNLRLRRLAGEAAGEQLEQPHFYLVCDIIFKPPRPTQPPSHGICRHIGGAASCWESPSPVGLGLGG